MLNAYNLEDSGIPAFPNHFRILTPAVLNRVDLPAPPFSVFNPASSLHSDLARFVEHIYDAATSELARRIETPPGSLSSAQIERGQEILREIRFAIARRRSERLVSLTGDYFSLLPRRRERHIGAQDVVIDTAKKVDDEAELLQLMRDVFQVQEYLEADAERKYRALGAQLCVLDRTSEEYERVKRKILDTHSWRHGFRLRVNRIFAAHLPEERRRFQADGEPIGNAQELFHGAPNANLVGILSRGLLIAPRSAPCAGAMFGKGIYFADQSSKSAQRCLWNDAENSAGNNYGPGAENDTEQPEVGYLFLADVALGRIKKDKLACYREQAPDGYDSVQGCKGLYLAHNEFIVYRAAQCALRYIAEIEAT